MGSSVSKSEEVEARRALDMPLVRLATNADESSGLVVLCFVIAT